MGIADGASGSSSRFGNEVWIIGGSTPSGSPQPCWYTVIGRAAFCQNHLTEVPCTNTFQGLL